MAKITGSKTTKAAETASLRKARTQHHVGVGQLFTQPNAHTARENAKKVLEEALAAGVDGREPQEPVAVPTEDEALAFVLGQEEVHPAVAQAVRHVRPTARYSPNGSEIGTTGRAAEARQGSTIVAPKPEVKATKTIKGWEVLLGDGLATEKQAEWMISIAHRPSITDAMRESLKVRLEQGFNRRAASQFITTYKDIPTAAAADAMVEAIAPGAATEEIVRPATETVPAGTYGIHKDGEVKCYDVDHGKGKWAGYIFVERISSDDRWKIRNASERKEILAAIAVDIQGAETLAALTLRRCKRCGRGLSDTKNPYFHLGLGPECGSK